MGLLDRAIRSVSHGIDELGTSKQEPQEQKIYRKGFNDGRRGDPRDVWEYESEGLKAAYNKGYNDGQTARRSD